MGRWQRAIIRAERELVPLGCKCALIDVVTALSGCFAPVLSIPLNVVRFVSLAVFVPAVLRTLAIRYADRPDPELMKAIAAAVSAAAVYVVVRTIFVVQLCALL